MIRGPSGPFSGLGTCPTETMSAVQKFRTADSIPQGVLQSLTGGISRGGVMLKTTRKRMTTTTTIRDANSRNENVMTCRLLRTTCHPDKDLLLLNSSLT